MKLNINIPDYDDIATDVIWKKNSKIDISYDEKSVYICGNKNALISLAEQLLYFAYNKLPNGSHVHYDNFFCDLQKDSKELVISRNDNI